MVGSVLPRANEESTWGFRGRLGLHVFGSVSSALFLGAALGGLGGIPEIGTRDWAFQAAGAIALVYSVRESGLLPIPAPQSRRQVPNKWRRTHSARAAALLYGAGLGVGLATPIAVTTFYVVPVWALLSGDVVGGAVVMAAFGAGRVLPLLPLSRQGKPPSFFVSFGEAVHPLKPVVALLNGLALVVSGTYLLLAGSSA